MNRLGASLCLASLLACEGPTTNEWVPLAEPPRPMVERGPDDVEVFTAKAPPRQFREVGIIGIEQGLSEASASELLAQLRARAGERGCDAVVVRDWNYVPPGRRLAERGYRGTCIVYTLSEDDR
jgi:hypothetical protein